MAANTNFERVSDWLTTLLIGVTLVQIKDTAAWVGGLGKGLLQGGTAANDAIIPVIVIYFFTLAVVRVYLITRLYGKSAFVQTLGMLTGSAQEISDPNVLADARDAALSPRDCSKLQAALTAFGVSNISEADSANPQPNAKLARAAAQSIATRSPTGRSGNPVAELKSFVVRAAVDPAARPASRVISTRIS
jgi:hypothetical protein